MPPSAPVAPPGALPAASPTPQEAAYPYGPYAPDPYATERARSALQTVGALNIVAGVLGVLVGLFMVLEIFVVASGMADDQFIGPNPPPKEFMIGLFVVWFVLSAATGGAQLWGGIILVGKKPHAARAGVIAAIAGCISVWHCCVWPLSLGAGIYTLVVLSRDEVRQGLEQGTL